MVTVTANLKDISGNAIPNGKAIFQLCGFGAQVPRVSGTTVIAKTGQLEVEANGSGAISVTLYGNDVIIPSGTYYTVTITDANGDIVQCNAYQFAGSATYALDSAAQYNPN